jgi:hypothetical protein
MFGGVVGVWGLNDETFEQSNEISFGSEENTHEMAPHFWHSHVIAVVQKINCRKQQVQ